MALEEYKRKRDFKKTPEPAPSKTVTRQGFSYLIQKHDATRLHYDLRLELDGVLLSWAVTKGPSRDPSVKRLAVRTEDHPLSYGTFEGTIPKGEYGGGTVMLWDNGSWEPKGDPHYGLQKGHLAFILHGQRLKGAWDLVRMHGQKKEDQKENWLLVKTKDNEAQNNGQADQLLKDASTSITTHRTMEEIALDAPLPKNSANLGKNVARLMAEYPDVELATAVAAPPDGDDWVHEIKFDGYRLLAFYSDGEVRLRTRNGNDWTRKFPSISASVAKLKTKSAVLDMEAVVLDSAGKSNFQAMQQALGENGRAQSIHAYVFDLLYLDGKDLKRETLLNRKAALQGLLKKSKDSGFLLYGDHVVGHGPEILQKSCAMGLEGIISKLGDSLYQFGRQKSWLKSKCTKRQEFVIIGYTAAQKGYRAIGALHLGHRDDGEFKYAGKVGTGFGIKGAQQLYDRLSQLKVSAPPVKDVPRSIMKAATWVKPEILCEVSFAEWTEDGHIRHSSFQGLREDKNPQDVTMERPIRLKPNEPAKQKPEQKKKNADRLDVLGVSVSHPDRVIFQDTGLTKGQLAQFYAAAVPWILKDLGGHPVSLLRCPEGMAGDCFFQRNPGTGLGPDVKSFRWKHKGKWYEYLYIDNEKGVIEFVQMGAIELHPWGARVDKIDYPDRLIFDLDPAPEVPFDAVKLAARDLRRRLEKKGLESFLKCTGGKGLHVSVPLLAKDNWEKAKSFCAGVAEEMVREVPAAYVATMSKDKRKGKIFVDYFRNDYTATAIADYSVRARPGAPVAVPLEWRELDKLRAGNQFSVSEVLKRLKKRLRTQRVTSSARNFLLDAAIDDFLFYEVGYHGVVFEKELPARNRTLDRMAELADYFLSPAPNRPGIPAQNSTRHRIFLLSPANASGVRARLILGDSARTNLAMNLRGDGVPLGDAFSFISGLYFRGKLTYARTYANPPSGTSGVFVITASGGLISPDKIFTLGELREVATGTVDEKHPGYRIPLERDARKLCERIGEHCETILLGSVATPKYVEPLLNIFGARLMFPSEFVGRGDMSRGGLLLRCAREKVELTYVPVAGSVRQGKRTPKLAPIPRSK